jgi:hypothetical protein
MRMLPTLALEPPPRYVAFVASHLEPLREEAAGVVGGPADAEQLYPEVLTDVAVRWRRLELRSRLSRGDAADSYLRRAFVRRSRRWREESFGGGDWATVDIEVGRVDRAPRRAWSSGATRIAAFVRPAPNDRAILAEAAVAWWHAYEAHRRRRYVAALVAVLVLCALIWRVTPPAGG